MAKAKTQPKKYCMLQLDENIHSALKEYCDHHGFKLKGFVQALIRQALKERR